MFGEAGHLCAEAHIYIHIITHLCIVTVPAVHLVLETTGETSAHVLAHAQTHTYCIHTLLPSSLF